MTEHTEKVELKDTKTSKRETSILLSAYAIGTAITVVGIDLITVALGIKATISLPIEVHASSGAIVLTLLGYIIGRKSNGI